MSVALASYAPGLFAAERFEQRKSDVNRLIILCRCARNISCQRPDCTTRWCSQKFLAAQKPRRILSCQPAHGHRLHITFDSGDLSGKEDVWMRARLHGC